MRKTNTGRKSFLRLDRGAVVVSPCKSGFVFVANTGTTTTSTTAAIASITVLSVEGISVVDGDKQKTEKEKSPST